VCYSCFSSRGLNELIRRRMEPMIIALAGLSNSEVATLSDAGVLTSTDLMILAHEDISEVLPNATIFVKRKLSTIGRYLILGGKIEADTTMQSVMQFMVRRQAPPVVYLNAGLEVNGLEEFSGGTIEWEDWERGTSATLGQTVYSILLHNPPPKEDPVMQAQNRVLFNMLKAAIYKGNALHVVDSVNGEDGHAAWQALIVWYGTGSAEGMVIDHYCTKLKRLVLNEDTTASEYINTFVLCCQKLEAKNEGYTDSAKKRMFLKNILVKDYNIEIALFSCNYEKTFDDCVQWIRECEQRQLGKRARAAATKRAQGNKKVRRI
jgi:hypothetical protein